MQITITILLLCGLLQAVNAHANLPLYAIDGNFPADSGQTSQLYRIDPQTGAVLDVVGDTGFNLTAIAYSLQTGTFYATTALQSEPASFLVEIDPVTASIARGPAPPANVPTLSHAGLALLALAFLMAACWMIRINSRRWR
ncbi:MAG: IPTL-CTERM sorting domain-containing protein [Pseudomonadota bacterium]